jgi:NADPH:quinone reductase-like Zn-dependent oxidoreductase
MKYIKTAGLLGCKAPFDCVKLETKTVPTPKSGEALIRINASSVNPSDVDIVSLGGCDKGCGADISGTVVQCPGCTKLKVGDAVWTNGFGAYAEFITLAEAQVGLKPTNLGFRDAATIPEVGLTSLFSLKRTGSEPDTPMPPASPWTKSNVTVVITAGSGGTGFIGIEIAKAYGATHIATATTGEAGIAFVKSLGATIVTDYMKEDIFDVLPADSVDNVYDNYGAEGTADKAMKVLRSGGTYLLMPHGECYSKKTQGPPCLSANPKPGVRQLNYVTAPDYSSYGLQGLNELKSLFEAAKLTAHIDKSFDLKDVALAFNYSAGPGEGGVSGHIGKISIVN